MRKCIAILCVLFLLSGCVRSPETDLVLFCKALNERLQTEQIREEDAMRLSDCEYLLTSGNVLIRLQTEKNGAIHTVTLTAKPQESETLCLMAEDAFAILAQQAGESVPPEFVQMIREPSAQVRGTETKEFVYQVYASKEGITVQQRSSRISPVPVRPTVRPG